MLITQFTKIRPSGSFVVLGHKKSFKFVILCSCNFLPANDIAILKLARPIKFSKNIKPIDLPSGPKDAAGMESSCNAGGWGRTQAKGQFSLKHAG
jgi:hypothetical protein